MFLVQFIYITKIPLNNGKRAAQESESNKRQLPHQIKFVALAQDAFNLKFMAKRLYSAYNQSGLRLGQIKRNI